MPIIRRNKTGRHAVAGVGLLKDGPAVPVGFQ